MNTSPEIIELSEEDSRSFTQGNPPIYIRLRWWLIRKIAGRMPILLNLEVSPHTREQCGAPWRVMNCSYGLFSAHIIAGNGCGITMRQVEWSEDK